MGYCDINAALAQLGLDPDDADDATDVALLRACDAAVSAAFEAKAGYDPDQSPVWGTGVTATATTRTVHVHPGDGSKLFLPVPARSVGAVRVEGAAEETIAADQWTTARIAPDGTVWEVHRTDGGYWPYSDGLTWVEVDAIWADGPVSATVPALVTQAVTFLAVDEYLLRKTSPAGEIGPEGLTFRPRNPWGVELVRQAIDAYRAPAPLVLG